MVKMVNDLFLITRYDAKKISMDLQPLILNDLILEIYEFFSPIAQEKKIDFNLSLEPDIKIELDKIKILQLINNLIDNAVYFTPSNGVITISLKKADNDVVIKVSDTGIGIPDNEFENVFNRFYQVERARSGTNRGTGLGLQICRRIVEAHNGNIEISKFIPRGTVVTVSLPQSPG
jgi:signal transduction histidine kinase